MKSKLLGVVAATVLLSGCATHGSAFDSDGGFEKFDGLAHEQAHAVKEAQGHEQLNRKVYYNGVNPGSQYAMGVMPSHNFFLGAGYGINSVQGMGMKGSEDFAAERENTLRQLCKKRFPEEFGKTLVKVVEKNTEMCSINYEADIPLRSVYFETGKTYLTPAFFPMLDFVVELMEKNSDSILKITGFTDSTGNLEINEKISKGRAQAIKDYLVKEGIDESRFVLSSKAKSQYLLDNSEVLNRAINRRAELVFNFNLPNFPK